MLRYKADIERYLQSQEKVHIQTLEFSRSQAWKDLCDVLSYNGLMAGYSGKGNVIKEAEIPEELMVAEMKKKEEELSEEKYLEVKELYDGYQTRIREIDTVMKTMMGQMFAVLQKQSILRHVSPEEIEYKVSAIFHKFHVLKTRCFHFTLSKVERIE